MWGTGPPTRRSSASARVITARADRPDRARLPGLQMRPVQRPRTSHSSSAFEMCGPRYALGRSARSGMHRILPWLVLSTCRAQQESVEIPAGAFGCRHDAARDHPMMQIPPQTTDRASCARTQPAAVLLERLVEDSTAGGTIIVVLARPRAAHIPTAGYIFDAPRTC